MAHFACSEARSRRDCQSTLSDISSQKPQPADASSSNAKKMSDVRTPLAAGEVTWDPPHYAAGAWHEFESPAGTANPGKVFYHNSVTGEVQWAKPEVTAWIIYHEDL